MKHLNESICENLLDGLEKEFEKWSDEKRKAYFDFLEKNINTIIKASTIGRGGYDKHQPIKLVKCGVKTACAYGLRYYNNAGVRCLYEFRGHGLGTPGLYGCLPNIGAQKLWQEFNKKYKMGK